MMTQYHTDLLITEISNKEHRPAAVQQVHNVLRNNGKSKIYSQNEKKGRNQQEPETYACLSYIGEIILKNKLERIPPSLPSFPTKQRNAPKQHTNSSYDLECDCGKSYNGQTGRSIHCRIKERRQNTKRG